MGIETAEEVPDGQLFIIPLRLDDCPVLSEKLSKYQYQDMFPDWTFAVERIIKSIKLSISHIPLKTEIRHTQKSITTSATFVIKNLKTEILSGSAITTSISKILDPEISIFLKPVDIVWLKNELYGYSFTDRNNKKTYINDEEILPGNPDYRKIKGKVKIAFRDSRPGQYDEFDFPMFLGQPISEIEQMADRFGKYQPVMNIRINDLPRDQYDIIKDLAPDGSILPINLTKIEVDKCLSQLRLKIHKLLDETLQ